MIGAVFTFLFGTPKLLKFLSSEDNRFMLAILLMNTIAVVLILGICGIIGKLIFHNLVKIKCEKCGEINRGDIEYCTKCNYQIQNFKSNKLF
jgi:hypothetical protein